MSAEPMKNKAAGPPGGMRGALVWRAVRYGAVAGAGYLFGLAAGSVSVDTPSLIGVGIIGAIALLWVFRAGVKSQQHAAADAAAAAIATATAAAEARATQQVTVAGGHVVHGQVHGEVPVEVYDRSAPRAEPERVPVFELQRGSTAHDSIYEVGGQLRRGDELSAAEQARIVPLEAQQ